MSNWFAQSNPKPYIYSAGDSMETIAAGNMSNNVFDIKAGKDSILGSGGMADQGLGALTKGVGIASSLGGIYVGLKSLGIAEDELDIKKDKWAMGKQEIQHMQATRKRLTASYMGNGPTNNRATVAGSQGPGPTRARATASLGGY